MKQAAALVLPIVSRSPLMEWMRERCRSDGVELSVHTITADNIAEYKPLLQKYRNVITWSYRMPHAWMAGHKKNMLFVDNSIVHQRSGIFVDNRGLFSESNLCVQQTWRFPYACDLDELSVANFGWNLFAGGSQTGPILVALQCRNDAALKYEFPLGAKADDKVIAVLDLLARHLPAGRQVLIRPHPRERSTFTDGGVWRQDWRLDMHGTFAERLPQCSALVTVNSTCATEAALLGVPIATLGTGGFTDAGVSLDCSRFPERLALLDRIQPDKENVKKYISAIMCRHFLPYSAQGTRSEEFDAWLKSAAS